MHLEALILVFFSKLRALKFVFDGPFCESEVTFSEGSDSLKGSQESSQQSSKFLCTTVKVFQPAA